MTDLQFLLWTAPLLAPYALYTRVTQCQGRERMRVLGLAGLAGVFMLAPALIEPIPALLQTRGLKYTATDAYSLESFSYPLNWLVARDPGRADENMGQLLPLLTLVCLPLTGRRRQRWMWLAVGVGSLILALGPFLRGTDIPLPYLLLHRLMDEQYRTPYRFTTPAAFALIAFVALSLANLFERPRITRWQPWIVGAVMLVWVFDSDILAPFPVDYMPDYRIYHQIGRDPAEYALLEIPVGPASGFGEFGDSPNLQYYAYIHHKQLINGTVSRIPSDGLDRFERSPLLRGLTGEYDFPSYDAASLELANKLTNWDLRYVLVHRNRLLPARAHTIVQFLNVQPELCLVDEQDDLLAYRRISAWADCPQPEMTALPAGTTRLALSDPRSVRYIGPGWYDVEDIGGQAARWAGEISTSTLRLVLPPDTVTMRFRALAYSDQQAVTVSFDGRPVAVVNLKNDWAEYQIGLPPGALPAQGPVVIRLAHQRVVSPFDRTGGSSPDKRPLSAAYDYFEFTPAP